LSKINPLKKICKSPFYKGVLRLSVEVILPESILSGHMGISREYCNVVKGKCKNRRNN
jgi:hypothetical protein